MFKRISVCAVFLLCLLGPSARAEGETASAVTEKVPFFKRFSFHTNIVDWTLTVPNLGLEFDLQKTEKTRFSILVNGKFNWNTSHIISPRLLWNVQSGAVEVRKYWRTSEIGTGNMGKQTSRDTTIFWLRDVFGRFRHNVLSGRTMRHPRYWRAYYVGLHASMDKFTYCFGKNGKQGSGINVGISGGYSIPLYPFKNGKSIDLDLGAVVVAKMAEYDKFRYEEESACYVYTGTKGKHIVPFPVLHDVHVSLVYRFNSIANKVKGEATRYEQKRDEWQIKRNKREKRMQVRWEEKHFEGQEALRKKDSVQLERQRTDSLKRVAKNLKKQEEQLAKDSLKKQKLQLKEAVREQADTMVGTDEPTAKKAKRSRAKDKVASADSKVKSKKNAKAGRTKPEAKPAKKRKEKNENEE